MITVDQLLESARQSRAAAEKTGPVIAKAVCSQCGDTFLIHLDRPGRYQFDCANDGCRARVQVEA